MSEEVVGNRAKKNTDVLVNEYGGVLITKEHIKNAFEFLDVEKRGKLNAENIKRRLGCFYKSMTTKDCKLLMNNESEITQEGLEKLLLDNEISDAGFDPVEEAFRAYDPNNSGFVDTGILHQVFESLGFGSLTSEDISILIATGDQDGDGRINLNDFRNMLYPQE